MRPALFALALTLPFGAISQAAAASGEEIRLVVDRDEHGDLRVRRMESDTCEADAYAFGYFDPDYPSWCL